MKKTEKIVMEIAIAIGVVALCTLLWMTVIQGKQKEKQSVEKPKTETKNIEKEDTDYSLEKAVEKGYFVIGHQKIYNKEKLESFIQNTEINNKDRKEDSMKIVQYTTEGDPIVTELSYKKATNESKATYILKVDNTQDKWSAPDDRKVRVNDDIPGSVYGITKREEGNTTTIELALYAEIDYIDESVKPYENIFVCSYPTKAEEADASSFSSKDFELRFYDKKPQTDTKANKILEQTEIGKDYAVYTYEGSVNVLLEGKEISLREAILQKKLSIEDILTKAEQDLADEKIKGNIYRDGGSKIYQYSNYTILKCNRLDGEKDLYIGPKEFTINDLER